MTRRPCLTCGRPTDNGPRCPQHGGRRDYKDERARRRILREWLATQGYVCAGIPEMGHASHPSPDLTIDHVVPISEGGRLEDGYRVVCRSINAARGAHGPHAPIPPRKSQPI